MTTPPFQVSNEFGSLVIEPITDFIPVGEIHSDHPAALVNQFDLTTAEKVALITQNKGIQVCFVPPFTGRAYMALHDSPSTAAICRVSVLEFLDDAPPAEIIDRMNQGGCRYVASCFD